jgi:hypothetical protein
VPQQTICKCNNSWQAPIPAVLFTDFSMLDRCPCAPAESLSTLKFANRAKNIKNAARLNEDVDQRTLLRKYECELKRLRAELLARKASLVDARRLLQVSAPLDCGSPRACVGHAAEHRPRQLQQQMLVDEHLSSNATAMSRRAGRWC